MHNRQPLKAVGDTGQSKLDPVDVVIRLRDELAGRGVECVIVGSIQLKFFPPSAMAPSAGAGATVPEQAEPEQPPVDLDTYHVDQDA